MLACPTLERGPCHLASTLLRSFQWSLGAPQPTGCFELCFLFVVQQKDVDGFDPAAGHAAAHARHVPQVGAAIVGAAIVLLAIETNSAHRMSWGGTACSESLTAAACSRMLHWRVGAAAVNRHVGCCWEGLGRAGLYVWPALNAPIFWLPFRVIASHALHRHQHHGRCLQTTGCDCLATACRRATYPPDYAAPQSGHPAAVPRMPTPSHIHRSGPWLASNPMQEGHPDHAASHSGHSAARNGRASGAARAGCLCAAAAAAAGGWLVP